ncbi:hypothetical protein ACMFMF_008989 [Clarireedia jacksonii]
MAGKNMKRGMKETEEEMKVIVKRARTLRSSIKKNFPRTQTSNGMVTKREGTAAEASLDVSGRDSLEGADISDANSRTQWGPEDMAQKIQDFVEDISNADDPEVKEDLLDFIKVDKPKAWASHCDDVDKIWDKNVLSMSNISRRPKADL